MALQVWLPLNGNLNNQGLKNVSVTNNGATVNSAGKIGSCYAFNGSSSYLTFSTTISLDGDHSICCWLDLTNVSAVQYFVGFSSGGGIRYSGSDNSFLYYAGGVTKTWTYTKVNRFVHVAFVCGSNTISLYVDGQPVGSSQSLTTRANCTNIGRRSDGYYYNGKINDFRIYDHCLSPKEVKEIAKGLVLHYKLDDWQVLMSKCKNVTWNQLVQNGDFSSGTEHWSTAITPKARVSVSNGELTLTKTWEDSTGAILRQDYIQTTNTSHKYYIKAMAKTVTDGQFGVFGFHNSVGILSGNVVLGFFSTSYETQSAIVSPVRNTDSLCLRAGQSASPSGTTAKYKYAICIDLTQMFGAGNEPSLAECTIMFALHWYPYDPGTVKDLSLPIPDCSGYGRNGTIYGTQTLVDNTPRYSKATKYPDSNCSIGIGNLSTYVPDGNFTFSIWFKKVTGEWSTKNWETIFGGPSGFELEAKVSSSNSPKLRTYSWGNAEIPYSLDVWNHIAFTRDSSGTKLYLNGELVFSGNAGTIPSGDYFIGSWYVSTNQNFRGHLSDARIYSTVLSESDIKDLYQTSAAIHNTGNIEAMEFVETASGSPEVTKTGQFKAQAFNEVLMGGLQQYEWLQSDGRSYINTGIPYDSTKETYRIECKFSQPTNVGQWDAIFGAYTNESYKTLRIIRLNSDNELGCYYNDKAGGGNPIILTSGNSVVREVVMTSSSLVCTENGVTTTYSYGTRVSATNTTATFCLFNLSPISSAVSKSKIYYFRFYDNNVLLHDFIPCKYNGAYGMYDTVTNQFFTNAGSGSFTAGGECSPVAAIYAGKTESNQIIEI